MANWKITRVNYEQQGDYRLISSLRWRADAYDSASGKSASEQGLTGVAGMGLYYDSADTSTEALGQQEYLDALFSQLGYGYVDGVGSRLASKVAVSAPVAVAPTATAPVAISYDNTDSDYWIARFDTIEYVNSKSERYALETDLDSATRSAMLYQQVKYTSEELQANTDTFLQYGVSSADIDTQNSKTTAGKLELNILEEVYDGGWAVRIFDSYYGDPTSADDAAYEQPSTLPPYTFEVEDSIGYNYSGDGGATEYDGVSLTLLGYFKANYTGDHTFYTNSDDFSYLWIGDNAINNAKVSNADIDNGGTHAMVELSTTKSLVAGTYYPIKIRYGNIGGNEGALFASYEHTGQAKTNNWNGVIFHNNTPMGPLFPDSDLVGSYDSLGIQLLRGH